MRRAAVTGILLAGGRARRMGGGDKGLLRLAGRSLAARTLERLAAQTGAVVVNANRNRAEYERLGAAVAPDIVSDFAGPLAGIHAGMVAARTEWILSAPCDSPFFPEDLAERLWRAAAAAGAEVATARAGGRAHPVFMLAKRGLRGDLAAFLEAGGRKIDEWRNRRKWTEAEFPDAAAFANINTPEELEELGRRTGE